jgi:hypothetical protein
VSQRAHAHFAPAILPTSSMRPAAAAPRRNLKAAVFLVAFLGLLLQAACLSRLQAPPPSPRQQQQVRVLCC